MSEEIDNLTRRVTELEIQFRKIIENQEKIMRDIQNYISEHLIK